MAAKCISWAATALAMVQLGNFVFAGAFNFQEPTEWAVGDPGSTYNNWESAPDSENYLPAKTFSITNTSPSSSSVSPSITSPSNLNTQSPGFVAGSGGYYSLGGDYPIFSNVYNHGGSAASTTDYLTGYGTRVIVQTAATLNPGDEEVEGDEFGVYEDSVEIIRLVDGTPLVGGTNEDLLSVTEVFLQEVLTSFGYADQQELVFEFYLPAYSGDFQVRFESAVHSSFQELRIDTLLVEESTSNPGDFDGDGDVDSDDLADWQTSYGVNEIGDSDGDGDSDGRDFLLWQRNYTGPQPVSALSVPEPTSLLVVIFGIMMVLANRIPTWNR